MNRVLASVLLLSACSGSPDEPSSTKTESAVASAAAPAAVPAKSAEPVDVDEVPAERFTNGARAFGDVREALLKSYYADGLTEDDLYRAATAGMLEKLEPRMKKYNQLLGPREIAELRNDLHGEVVGIGVQISFDEASGYTDVLGALPGSPAEKAGLVTGDKIVTVNGKLFKGMHLTDVVADIRGKSGESVKLSVLHGDKLVSMTLVREKVQYESPIGQMFGDHLGYVRIPSFTEKTPAAVKDALTALERDGAKALVVDLRGAPGGSFEKAVETAELLVPAGAPIVALRKRGKKEELRSSTGRPILGNVPAVVLVDHDTASGAEFLAAALHDERHARLVGGRTFGKWSVQSLDDLPNGYAAKYTIGLFATPAGKSYEGVGLAPDIELATDGPSLGRALAAKPGDRLAIDVPLRTAKELLAPAP